MEENRRAEQLVSRLRWAMVLVIASAGDRIPYTYLGAAIVAVVIYNGIAGWYASDSNRFAVRGRVVTNVPWALDIAVITFVVAKSGAAGPPYYLLYWFVLVGAGFANTSLTKLAVVTAWAVIANAAATACFAASMGNWTVLAMTIGVRTTFLIAGSLVSVYVAKTRSQDELAVGRGSYLRAILDCGTKLTSVRNVQELASQVLSSAVEETGATEGQILLVNTETQELECEAVYVRSGVKTADDHREACVRSHGEWVVSTGREFLSRSSGKNDGEVNAARDEPPSIAVPLIWESSASSGEGRVLGVMVVVGFPGRNFHEDALSVVRIFAAISSTAIINLRLYTNLQKSFLRTLQSLANGLEARDEYTRGHSDRVMNVACMIAEELNVPDTSLHVLRNASLLHDIGKIGVPDAMLKKAGKLTAEEWETMRRHPLVSEEICRPLGLPADVLFLIKHHHERLDSKGYPSGLGPRDQPLLQRILVVADTFDAMRSRRPYRDPMPKEDLRLELSRCAGISMDPTVVETLLSLLERGDFDSVYAEHDRLTQYVATARPELREAA
jgi:putative nucleotidyltransferase with HDIG domain